MKNATALLLFVLLSPLAAAPQEVAKYVCVLHTQVQSDKPGVCPVCGNDLIPSDLASSGLFSFTCPDHRELQMSAPGKCPKCGKALVAEDLRRKQQVTYLCPMHPAVTSSFPLKCPRCGMDLVREDQLEKKSAAYRCPMDPDVVSGKPATCSRCGMKLFPVDASELVHFPTALSVEPTGFRSGQRIRLRFQVQNPVTGEQVREFDIVHDKRLHLFIVSQDLDYFDHIHPEQADDGSFSVETTLPRPGYYRVFADFLPTGGAPQLIQKSLVTADCRSDLFSSLARLAPDENPSRTTDGMTVTLTTEPATFIAGREAALSYYLKDAATGAPVTDLQPYLAAWGHTFILNEDGSEPIHTHPADEVPPGAERSAAHNKPEISFQAFFPKPGFYRVWTQFQRRDRVSTFVFTIEVKRLQ